MRKPELSAGLELRWKKEKKKMKTEEHHYLTKKE